MKTNLNKLTITLLIVAYTFIGFGKVAFAATNLINNGSLEIASSNPSLPQGWFNTKSGNNTTVFSYQNLGQSGSSEDTRSLKIQMTARANGEAKWYFTEVPVTPGQQYKFTDQYRSTTTTSLQLKFKYLNGSTTTSTLANLSAASAWKASVLNFTAPQKAVSVTVMHTLAKIGTLETDNYSLINTSDTVAPTVTITSPVDGASVSGIINVNATASDNLGVSGVQFYVDANPVGNEITTAPYTYNLDTTILTNGAHTLLAKAIDAAGNQGSSTQINVSVANVVQPQPIINSFTAAPSSIIAGQSTTLSWNTLNANSLSIDKGVGTVSGESVIVTPTQTTTYTLTASNTSGVVTKFLTVSVASAGPNLIQNPSLEASAVNQPNNWTPSSWGSNTNSFIYPVVGPFSPNAAKIMMTQYTDGDAKWYFDPVSVLPNTQYEFSDVFSSNTTSRIVAAYTDANGAITYEELANNVASSNLAWSNANVILTTSPTAKYLTIYHLIQSVGEISVDDFSLRQINQDPADLFTQGIVSLTFDDGWTSQYDNGLPIMKAANMHGTFYIITQNTIKNTPAANYILNPSLETSTANQPNNWNHGNWGTNTTTFTYPVAGKDGANAAQVSMLNYTDGDAKWFPDDITVAGNTTYRYTDFYKASTNSKITLRFTLADNSYQYLEAVVLPSSNDWKYADVQFTTPSTATSMTVFHLLSSNGDLAIDQVGISLDNTYLTTQQMLSLAGNGHDIGSHTKTHPSLTSISPLLAQQEIEGSKLDLINAGINPVFNIAYPYGDFNDQVKQMVQNAGYATGRSTLAGYNTKGADKYALRVQNVEASTPLSTVQSWINTAATNHTWLILVFHQIENLNPPQYGTSTSEFQQIINYIQTVPVTVKTIKEASQFLY